MRILYFEDPLVFVLSSKIFFCRTNLILLSLDLTYSLHLGVPDLHLFSSFFGERTF